MWREPTAAEPATLQSDGDDRSGGKGVRAGVSSYMQHPKTGRPVSPESVSKNLDPPLLMCKSGAPWNWTLWRLHLIPFAEHTDPNLLRAAERRKMDENRVRGTV